MSIDVRADRSLAQPEGERRCTFLSAEWRYLVMLNFDVPARVLLPFVPAGTELDLWRGRALVSVVGFRFLRTKVLGVPLPFHRNFDEVNLRFYVKRVMPDGQVRRGVTFIREIVPRAAIAQVARLWYNEPYVHLPMWSNVQAEDRRAAGPVQYMWKAAGGWASVKAMPVGAATLYGPETEAYFITEHYWGYTRQRDGGTVEYEVSHPQWEVWEADKAYLSEKALQFYGAPFQSFLGAGPCSAFIAKGSPVKVFMPRRLTLR